MSYLNGSIGFLSVFIMFSVPASVIDIKQNRIPDWIVFTGVIVLFGLRFFWFEETVKIILAEIIFGFLIFFVIRLSTKGKLGMGDVKFAALIGAFIGFPGWFVAVGLASFLGLVFALIGLFSGRINKNTKIPFVPFLTAGSIGACFVNYDILLKI